MQQQSILLVTACFLLSCLVSSVAGAADFTFSTLAGSTGTVINSVDGTGSAAQFSAPRGVAVDSVGNVYVADSSNNTIRKITAAGVVTTLAGTAGSSGFVNGTGTAAKFNEPFAVAVDSAGNVFVADTNNNAIRKITAAGVVTTFAGGSGPGTSDGTGSAARFHEPRGIAIDSAGTLYVADYESETVRKVTSAGVVTTLAGGADIIGSTNGQGTAARFMSLQGIAVDSAGNVYVTEGGNRDVRKITASGLVTTFVSGSSGAFGEPRGIAIDAGGNLYIGDYSANAVHKVTSAGSISTYAGTKPTAGSSDGTASALFYGPSGVAIDSANNLYVADTLNNTVRKISSTGTVTTFAGLAGRTGSVDGTATAARFEDPYAVAIDNSGNLFVADATDHSIRKITSDGTVTTLAGKGGSFGSTDGTGSSARFKAPLGIAADSSGNVYVADTGNFTVRKITSAGVVTTLAGSAGLNGSIDGAGAAARFMSPYGITVDSSGIVYVVESSAVVRKITAAGVVTTLAGSSGTNGFTDATGTAARFSVPFDITVDGSGNLYVSDHSNHAVRKITTAGVVTTLAGTGNEGNTNATGTAASFRFPSGIAVDSAGTVYLADTDNQVLRKITAAGVVTTIAGTGAPGSADGTGTAAGFYNPKDVAVDSSGNLFVVDRGNHTIRKGILQSSINGSCGTSDDQVFLTAPSTGLCSGGTGTAVTGSGPWSWSCTGSGGGTTAVCSTANTQNWTINTATGGNGTVSCTSPVSTGATSTCTVTPVTGYQLDTFSDNSVDKKSSVTGSSYGIANVTANHTIAASFTLATASATIQIGASTGTTIKPLLGENAGPLPASPQMSGDFTTQYKEIGVRSVRTHDHLIYTASVPSPNPTLYPGPLDMSTMYPDFSKDTTLSNSYNFTLSDQHFKAIVDGGFEPFFRIGDTAGLTRPPTPSERPNWEKAAIEILKHYTQGQWNGFNATINEVEIWNEPDSTGFWSRSQSEFMSLYVESALALRAAFPTLRIGGPGFTQGAVTSPNPAGWLPTFLDQVKAANAPLDFISFHMYSNNATEPATLATSLRATLDGRGFTSTKIYITEWNTHTDVHADLAQAQALRSGALGASTLSASWVKMQDAPIDRLFHYRGSDPNANTPEDYGLYTGAGTAKRTAWAYQQWSILAGTQERLATTVAGNSSLLTIAGKDANGKPVIMVVNTANAASVWTPTDSNSQALTGTWKLVTISDNSPSTDTSTPTFPVSIPAYGVQLLSVVPPVNGTCGTSSGATFTVAPSNGFCTTGSASPVTGGGPWNWDCVGSNGGTTASCQANKAIIACTADYVPVCGLDGITYSNSCNAGVAGVSIAYQGVCIAPANGACGSSSGVNVTAIPTANLCSVGTASPVTGSGPWNWSCAGTTGGTTVTCSAGIASPPATQYTVTPATGSGFAIAPATPQTVTSNATTSFTITPVSGYGIASVTGCSGSLNGTTYITGPVTANCSVSVTAVARTAGSGTSGPTISDALKVLQAVAGISTLTATEQIRYDVAPLSSTGTPLGNGALDAADVILILRRSIGIGNW